VLVSHHVGDGQVCARDRRRLAIEFGRTRQRQCIGTLLKRGRQIAEARSIDGQKRSPDQHGEDDGNVRENSSAVFRAEAAGRANDSLLPVAGHVTVPCERGFRAD
jgi:hypothetical protein